MGAFLPAEGIGQKMVDGVIDGTDLFKSEHIRYALPAYLFDIPCISANC